MSSSVPNHSSITTGRIEGPSTSPAAPLRMTLLLFSGHYYLIDQHLPRHAVELATTGNERKSIFSFIGQFDAEPWFVRRQYIAVLHEERIVDNLGVQRAKVGRDFQHGGVGAGET